MDNLQKVDTDESPVDDKQVYNRYTTHNNYAGSKTIEKRLTERMTGETAPLDHLGSEAHINRPSHPNYDPRGGLGLLEDDGEAHGDDVVHLDDDAVPSFAPGSNQHTDAVPPHSAESTGDLPHPTAVEDMINAHAYDLARDDHILRAHNVPSGRRGSAGSTRLSAGALTKDEHAGHEERADLLEGANAIGPHHEIDNTGLQERERHRYLAAPKMIEERLVQETLKMETRHVEETKVKMVTETNKKKVTGVKPYRVVERVVEVPQVVVKEKTKIVRQPKIEERVIEKPKIQIVEKIVEVPTVKEVVKEVVVPKVVFEERKVSVPKYVYEDRYIEVPRIIYNEKVSYEDRIEYREVIVDKVKEEIVKEKRIVKKRVEQLVPVYLVNHKGEISGLSDPPAPGKAGGGKGGKGSGKGVDGKGGKNGQGGRRGQGGAGNEDEDDEGEDDHIRTTETQEVTRVAEHNRVEFHDVPVVKKIPVPTYRVVYPDGRKRIAKRVPGYPMLPMPHGYARDVLGMKLSAPEASRKGEGEADDGPTMHRGQETVRLGVSAALHDTHQPPPVIQHSCHHCGSTREGTSLRESLHAEFAAGGVRGGQTANGPPMPPGYRLSSFEAGARSSFIDPANYVDDPHDVQKGGDAHLKRDYNSIHPYIRHGSQMEGLAAVPEESSPLDSLVPGSGAGTLPGGQGGQGGNYTFGRGTVSTTSQNVGAPTGGPSSAGRGRASTGALGGAGGPPMMYYPEPAESSITRGLPFQPLDERLQDGIIIQEKETSSVKVNHHGEGARFISRIQQDPEVEKRNLRILAEAEDVIFGTPPKQVRFSEDCSVNDIEFDERPLDISYPRMQPLNLQGMTGRLSGRPQQAQPPAAPHHFYSSGYQRSSSTSTTSSARMIQPPPPAALPQQPFLFYPAEDNDEEEEESYTEGRANLEEQHAVLAEAAWAAGASEEDDEDDGYQDPMAAAIFARGHGPRRQQKNAVLRNAARSLQEAV
ncbi:unnamed protein product [Amoebophrya sp. A25]|nr:unnamed protein product [Amoebophrya sp. A25]|eukprot:GSA25T00026845001.1